MASRRTKKDKIKARENKNEVNPKPTKERENILKSSEEKTIL
jgi:hypothetical protein